MPRKPPVTITLECFLFVAAAAVAAVAAVEMMCAIKLPQRID
jgi:hypothetical protein